MKHLHIILLILPLIGFGQGWEQTFGGEGSDEGFSVQQTTDGGYIITGSINCSGPQEVCDVYLIKTDGNGNEQWSQTFGGDGYDEGFSVQQTTDGGYIITGSTNVFGQGGSDVYLIKTDSNGNEQWSQTFGGTSSVSGRSVQQTTDGGYIITGTTSSNENNLYSDVYLLKTDGNGNEQWSQTFGGTDDDSGYSVQQTSDGGYIITGFTFLVGNGSQNVYLIKTDGNGNEQWSQTFGGTNIDWGFSVQQTSDGGYIILGDTQSISYEVNFYLIKTDGGGNEQWSQTFGGVSGIIGGSGRSVQQTSDGGYIMTGYRSSYGNIGNGSYDVYLIKTDGSGNEQWSQTLGGVDDERGYSVQQTSDGGYIITGGIGSPISYIYDVYLIKTDTEGNVETTSTIELPTPTSKRELVKTTNIIGQENTTIKNQPLIEIYDDGSTEKKIVLEK